MANLWLWRSKIFLNLPPLATIGHADSTATTPSTRLSCPNAFPNCRVRSSATTSSEPTTDSRSNCLRMRFAIFGPDSPHSLVSHLGPPGFERFRVIGLLHRLSADWDYRPTKEEILELNDPNQPRPDPHELEGDPNLLRKIIRQQAQQIMEEEVAALIGALGDNNPERTTRRNGYRARAWKTQASGAFASRATGAWCSTSRTARP